MKKTSNYSQFVSSIYSVITGLMPPGSKNLLTFAAGGKSVNGLSDSAFLRNEKALYFYNVLKSGSELFQIDTSEITLHRTLFFHDEVSIDHSCYPKNLRRWMKGQVPRKRRCRADFAVLTFCWITAFGSDMKDRKEYVSARDQVRQICRQILPEEICGDSAPLLELIWLASGYSYFPQHFARTI